MPPTPAIYLLFALCIASCSGGGESSPDATARTDADACDDQVEPVNASLPPAPDVMLVIDRSPSMSGSKWATMRAAIESIIDAYEARIHFGLVLFPTDAICAVSLVEEPESDNRAAIISELASAEPNLGGTPTPQAIGATESYFSGAPTNPGGSYAILATDGAPTCGDSPQGFASVQAVERLAAAGVDTFVVGFAFDSQPAILADMAAAGRTGDHYLANDADALLGALDEIAGEVGVSPCQYELEREVAEPNLLRVFFDEAPVPQTAAMIDGWSYSAGLNAVTFHGEACQALRAGDVSEVRVEFGCAGPIVQ